MCILSKTSLNYCDIDIILTLSIQYRKVRFYIVNYRILEETTAMVEIKREKENGYIFTLKAESGTTLLNSIPFSDENKVKEVLRSLHSSTKKVFERKTNHTGEFLFNVKNNTGQLIGSSQLYSSEAGMENGIKNLQNRIISLSHQNQL